MFTRLKDVVRRCMAPLKARIPERTWRRIVNLARLLLLVGGIGMVVVAIGMYYLAKSVYTVYKKAPPVLTEFGIDGSVSVKLPDPVRFAVTSINLNLPKTMHLEVPVDQVFAIPVNERFDVPVDTTVEVPFDQHVYVETTFPLNVEVPLDGLVAQTRVLGMTASVPLKGTFPLQMNVPFKGVVHIKTQLKVPFKQTLSVPVNQTLRIPIRTVFAVDLPIKKLLGSVNGPIDAEGYVIGELIPDVHVNAYLQKNGRLLVQPDKPDAKAAQRDSSDLQQDLSLPGQVPPAASAQTPQDQKAAPQQQEGRYERKAQDR